MLSEPVLNRFLISDVATVLSQFLNYSLLISGSELSQAVLMRFEADLKMVLKPVLKRFLNGS